jgi:hypothetical protein
MALCVLDEFFDVLMFHLIKPLKFTPNMFFLYNEYWWFYYAYIKHEQSPSSISYTEKYNKILYFY